MFRCLTKIYDYIIAAALALNSINLLKLVQVQALYIVTLLVTGVVVEGIIISCKTSQPKITQE